MTQKLPTVNFAVPIDTVFGFAILPIAGLVYGWFADRLLTLGMRWSLDFLSGTRLRLSDCWLIYRLIVRAWPASDCGRLIAWAGSAISRTSGILIIADGRMSWYILIGDPLPTAGGLLRRPGG